MEQLKTQKEILEYFRDNPDSQEALEEAIREKYWTVIEGSRDLEGFQVECIARYLLSYDEGIWTYRYVYSIDGALFLMDEANNSWGGDLPSYSLLPAKAVPVTRYEVNEDVS